MILRTLGSIFSIVRLKSNAGIQYRVKMMLNMFPYVYRIFQRIGMSNKIRKYILVIITYLFVLFLPQAENLMLKTFFVVLDRTIRNIVLALDALFVPVFPIAVTVNCWDACTK